MNLRRHQQGWLPELNSCTTYTRLSSWIELRRRPKHLFGRDSELQVIVNTLVAHQGDRTALAILGTGGVGKTSLALASLHHPKVAELYGSRRLFISCEAAADAKGVVSILAGAMRISGDTAMLPRLVLDRLGERPTLLVLDNYETPWEASTSRSGAEKLLALFNHIHGLAFVVTMRGAERPLSTKWTTPLLPLLQPFDHEAALQTVLTHVPSTTETDFAPIKELLDAVGNLPLAVHIVSAMLTEESADSLLQRWRTERTVMLNMGSDKMSSLDISIRISLHSERLTAVAGTSDLLVMISLFPDGIAENDGGLALFRSHVPRLRQQVSALKQACLAYSAPGGRLCVLPPVREHVLRHLPLESIFVPLLVDYCIHFMQPLARIRTDMAAVSAIVYPELSNLRSVTLRLLEAQYDDAGRILEYLERFVQYSAQCGIPLLAVLDHALHLATRLEDVPRRIDILIRLSEAYPGHKAAGYAREALELALKVQDTFRQAAAHVSVALAIRADGDRFEVRNHHLRAISLFPQYCDHPAAKRLLATSHEALGSLYYARIDEHGRGPAIAHMEQAKQVYIELGHADGIDACRARIAEFALLDARFLHCEREARVTLAAAQKTQDVKRECISLRVLCVTAWHRGDRAMAVEHIARHGQLWRKLGPSGVVPYIWSLKIEGSIEAENERFERADELFTAAFSETERSELQGGWEDMHNHRERGMFLLLRGDVDSASKDIIRALQLARGLKVGNPSDVADCLVALGKLQLSTERGDFALCSLICAAATYRRKRNISDIMEVLMLLGDALIQQADAVTGRNCYEVALAVQLSGGAAFDAGRCMLRLAALQVAQPNAFDEARDLSAKKRIEKAFDLFEANGNVAGVLWCSNIARKLGFEDPTNL